MDKLQRRDTRLKDVGTLKVNMNHMIVDFSRSYNTYAIFSACSTSGSRVEPVARLPEQHSGQKTHGVRLRDRKIRV